MENINIPTKITIMEKSAEINLDKNKKQKAKQMRANILHMQ